jgi:molybdopterin/thiamine biosynthesis adenylyltransferase
MSTLHGKTALVIGAGSLGGPAALTLASAGVGRIVLVDAGTVEASNLAGQPIFVEADLGEPRGAAAARRLSLLLPGVEVEVPTAGFDEGSATALVRAADLVVDASSHFPTMFLANDAAAAAGKALAHGGLLNFTAQLLTVVPGVTGCLRCLFEAPPPPAPETGVLGPLAGFAGSLLGAEAVRLLDGRPGAYAGRLLVHEARSGRSRSVPVKRRPGCAACGAISGDLAPLAGGLS